MSQGFGVRGQGSGIRKTAAGLVLATGAALLLTLACASSGEAQPKPKTAPSDGSQDFVFLAEARPLLIRVHVRVDGKALPAAWDDFMSHLFRYLDVKQKGYLGKDEVERAPLLGHIKNGGLGSMIGGLGMGKQEASPTLAEIDTNKDGKVTQAELADYYRKKGFTPFQVHSESEAGENYMMMAFGTTSTEATVDQVNDAIFKLIDVKKTGKLTKAELAKAPELLLRHDANEDEIIMVRELVPPAPLRKAGGGDGMMSNMLGGGKVGGAAGKNSRLMMIPMPGQAPAHFVQQVREYFPYSKLKTLIKKDPPQPNPKDEPLGLTRTDLGLDDATFAALDANRDGVLDDKELPGFVKRAPDLEFMIRLSGPGDSQRGVELINKKGQLAMLARQVKSFDGLALLDLPRTRVEMRGQDESAPDQFAGLLRIQMTAFFKQADKDGDGYLDATEASGGPFGSTFNSAFKAMDRDGDGKVSEKEFTEYLDFLADLQERSKRACVSLVLTDESRGLFDLLDANRDGQLSVREMRGAVALLDRLYPERRDHLTRADLPRSYRLTVRRGPTGASGDDYSALLSRIYGGGGKNEIARTPTKGPVWFRKMDINRDADISRKEWLGSEEIFRQIDADNDGLISVDEAERFDALHRKQK